MNIYWLDRISPKQRLTVGGKAKGLSKLIESHYTVADGFVATDVKTKQDIEELLSFWKQSGLKNVAVRSSATLEDGIEFSSAGQYESYLNVDSEADFIKAVKGCLASLNQPNIVKYRSFFAQGESDMNIIVQEMVDAKVAGVVFSNNPITREPNVIIEAVEGLGEGLVSGKKQAKSYTIERDKPNLSQKGLLNVRQLRDIYQGAIKTEEIWGLPMDLEWAIDQNDNVVWLQARPVTTLDDPTIDELNSPYQVDNDIITNHNVGEMLPGAITPLTISTVVYAIDYGIREMVTMVGMFKNIEAAPEEHIICHYYGHLFFNMRYLYRLQKIVFGAMKENVDIGICGKSIELESKDDTPMKRLPKRIYNGIKYGLYMAGANRARKKIVKVSDHIVFDESSIENLYNSITDNLKLLNKTLSYHYVTSAHSGSMSSAIFQILKADHKDMEVIKGKLASVLEDIDGIESVDILRSLRKVARAMLKANPEVKDFNTEELLEYTQNAPVEVREKLDQFLTRHGHRCILESELRSPGWKDDQLGFMAYLKTVLQTGGIEKEKAESHASENIENVLKPYKGIKRSILKYLINQARKGCKNREFSKSRMIYAIDHFKRAYKVLAEMMKKVGALPETDLIYFMTHKELGDLIYNHNPVNVKKSGIRRRLFAEQKRLKFEHVYLGVPKPIELTKEFAKIGLKLKGTPLSRGKAIGVARVIESMEDAHKLQPGEIMVAGYTDIGWSPYYAVIGGLVTEVGSALSHGAVVAREYALPTVSNIHLATSRIQTGDLISIDGEEGTVLLLQPANT